MTDDLVIRAQQALQGVSEGPWELIGGGEYVTGVGIPVAPDDGGVTSEDAEFIAAARQLVPDLVAALKESRTETERLRAQLADVKAACIETDNEKWFRQVSRMFDGSAFPHTVSADTILAIVNRESTENGAGGE